MPREIDLPWRRTAMSSNDLVEILRRNRELAARYAGAASTGHLRKLLEKAQADLIKRVNAAVRLGAGDEFQAIHAQAAIVQIRNVLKPLTQGMESLILSTSREVAGAAAEGTIEYVRAAEAQFHGIGAASSLQLHEAMILDNSINKTESSQLRRLMSSGDPAAELHTEHRGKAGILQRYGANVVTKFEERLAQKYLARKPWDQVREEIVSDSPFLQGKEPGIGTMWAERIVRTESSFAQNSANFQASQEMDESLGDMVKILSASFDNRTSADSYAVHGQIRRMNEAFESWYGSYMHPPNRPNDREVIVPHRKSWPIPAELAYKSDGEILSRWMLEGRKGTPPPRPRMTTISLDEFGKVQPLPESERVQKEQAPREQEPVREEPTVKKVYSGPSAVRNLITDLGPKVVEASPMVRAPDEVMQVVTGDRSPVVVPNRRPRRNAEQRLQDAIAALEKLEVNLERVPRVVHGFPVRHKGDSGYPDPVYSVGPTANRVAEIMNDRMVQAIDHKIEPKAVRLDRLLSYQPFAIKSAVARQLNVPSDQRDLIIVVKFQGKNYIHTGLAAATAAKLEGKLTAKAVVVDLDKELKGSKEDKPVVEKTKKASGNKYIETVPKWDAAYFESIGVRISTNESTDATEIASKVFTASGIPSIKSLEGVWGNDPDSGHQVKIQRVSVDKRGYEHSVQFDGHILDKNGEKIGNVVRTFRRYQNGELEVHHDYFKIDKRDEMGKGGGSGMLGRAVQAYQELGADYITVDSAWIGKYAWATFGYDWNEPAYQAESRGAEFASFAKKHGVPESDADRLAKEGQEHPWLLSQIDYKGIQARVYVDDGTDGSMQSLPLGKAFFLSTHGWTGKLSLDKNSPSYKRVYDRCISKKGKKP